MFKLGFVSDSRKYTSIHQRDLVGWGSGVPKFIWSFHLTFPGEISFKRIFHGMHPADFVIQPTWFRNQ